MQLTPYIFFYGRCEEALQFYRSVLGGSYELTRNTELPSEYAVDPASANKIMHAKFEAPGVAFMASDGGKSKSVDPEEGNISLALDVPDAAEGERVFAALGAGGVTTMPLGKAFWGGRFGIVQDRFGTEWMVTTP
ncbi:VOC family protein [bacterium]|nr:MAG: VOC family protein [bacterium]